MMAVSAMESLSPPRNRLFLLQKTRLLSFLAKTIDSHYINTKGSSLIPMGLK
jgi:hypothetical protein